VTRVESQYLSVLLGSEAWARPARPGARATLRPSAAQPPGGIPRSPNPLALARAPYLRGKLCA